MNCLCESGNDSPISPYPWKWSSLDFEIRHGTLGTSLLHLNLTYVWSRPWNILYGDFSCKLCRLSSTSCSSTRSKWGTCCLTRDEGSLRATGLLLFLQLVCSYVFLWLIFSFQRIWAVWSLRVRSRDMMLNEGLLTLPNDGVRVRYFELFEQNIQGMNTVIILNNSTRTRHFRPNAHLS